MPPAGGDVDHHQLHGPFALGLQREHALVFQRRGQSGGDGEHLRQQVCHRGRVGVLMDDLVGDRGEAHGAAADPQALDLERADVIGA